MKAKIKNRAFLKKNEDRGAGIVSEMLKLAGKTVTVESSEGGDYKVLEDPGNYTWQPWMFERFPKGLLKLNSRKVGLDSAIQGHYVANVGSDGSIKIGCTEVPFETVKKLFKAAERALRESK